MSETIEYDGATIAWGPAPDAPMTKLRGLYYSEDAGYPGDDSPLTAGFLAFWKEGVTALLDYHGTEDRFNTSIITGWTPLDDKGESAATADATGAAVEVREWVEGYGYGSVIVGICGVWEDVEGVEPDATLPGEAPRNDAGWRDYARRAGSTFADDEFTAIPRKEGNA